MFEICAITVSEGSTREITAALMHPEIRRNLSVHVYMCIIAIHLPVQATVVVGKGGDRGGIWLVAICNLPTK